MTHHESTPMSVTEERVIIPVHIQNRTARLSGRPYCRITWQTITTKGERDEFATNEGRDFSRDGTRKRWAMIGRIAGMSEHMHPDSPDLVEKFLGRPMVALVEREEDGSWDVKSYLEWDQASADLVQIAEAHREQSRAG